MAFIFFHTPKPRQFEIKTRYYDPQKEEREQRKKELGLSGEGGSGALLRSKIRRKWGHDRRAAKRQADLRKMIIFIILAFILIYLLFIR